MIDEHRADPLVDPQDARNHPEIARGHAVLAAAIVAERLVVAPKPEPGHCRPQPELVVLVGAQPLVETADRVVYAAPHDRHDEDRGLVLDDRGERRLRPRVWPGPRR